MKGLLKNVITVTKFIVAAFLLVVVFNFFFQRAQPDKDESGIEKMIQSLENEVLAAKKINHNFKYPIERRPAAEYQIVKQSEESLGGDVYIYICAVSHAVGQAQRAQTVINIGSDVKLELADQNKVIFLAADKDLCHESRVIATGYHVPSSKGWPGVSAGEWTWLVRTSNTKVTEEQIAATQLYIKHKGDYMEQFGSYGYTDPLNAFIEKELGRAPRYVSAGMWNDDFVKR